MWAEEATREANMSNKLQTSMHVNERDADHAKASGRYN